MSEYIVLLDPSLMAASKNKSYNIGDQIIADSIQKLFTEIFPATPVKRISSHAWLGDSEKNMINGARFAFVGGTNILTSDIRHFSRLTPEKKNFFTSFRALSGLFY